MALSSGGIAQFSSGAGRTVSITWPTFSDTTNQNNVPANALVGRNGFNGTVNGVGVTIGGATGKVSWQNYVLGSPGSVIAIDASRGSPAVQFQNLVAADFAAMKFNQGANTLELEQLGAGIQPDPFFRVFRFVARAVFPLMSGPLNPLAADIGMCIMPGNVASMNQGGNRPGIQFGPTDNGVFTLRTRKAFTAGYDFSQNFTYAAMGLPTPAESFCTYELRIISADNTGPAKLKAFANGVQVGPTLNFGLTAGLLPGPGASGGGFNGLLCQLFNQGFGAYSWYLKHVSLIWTTDEQGNL